MEEEQNLKMTNNIMKKKCTKCKKIKPINEFHKRKDNKLGFRSDCKQCVCSRQREYLNNLSPEDKIKRTENKT